MSFVLGGKFVGIDVTRFRELYEKLSKKKKYVLSLRMDLVTTV